MQSETEKSPFGWSETVITSLVGNTKSISFINAEEGNKRKHS